MHGLGRSVSCLNDEVELSRYAKAKKSLAAACHEEKSSFMSNYFGPEEILFVSDQKISRWEQQVDRF